MTITSALKESAKFIVRELEEIYFESLCSNTNFITSYFSEALFIGGTNVLNFILEALFSQSQSPFKGLRANRKFHLIPNYSEWHQAGDIFVLIFIKEHEKDLDLLKTLWAASFICDVRNWTSLLCTVLAVWYGYCTVCWCTVIHSDGWVGRGKFGRGNGSDSLKNKVAYKYLPRGCAWCQQKIWKGDQIPYWGLL